MEFHHLFRTKKTPSPVSTDLEGIDFLNEGPIRDLELRFVYMTKSLNTKDFFKVRDKYLVPTKIL